MTPSEPIVLPPPRFRTVMDYEDEVSLRRALAEPPFGVGPSSSSPLLGPRTIDHQSQPDWQTPHLDLDTSWPQSLNEEVKRLMALKEYSILDTEHNGKFERITALASRIFEAPISLICLVDIGRQWFLSSVGVGDTRETTRQVSFCAHAIQSYDEDVFIVPETHEDPRFRENGVVAGPPYIRFYAGVPLKDPQGHKLGTLCIMDTQSRPQGLSFKEKQNLRELAEIAMDTMVNRKQEVTRMIDEKCRLMACAAHDLMSPLTGIQLNLGLLMEDLSLLSNFDCHQKELLQSSLHCSEVIERICKTAIENFRGDLAHRSKPKENNDKSIDTEREEGLIKMTDLVKNVERVIAMYPKNVPVFVDVDENLPPTIVSDDLKLFRSMINYLTNACKHTHNGSIHLRIYARKGSVSESETAKGVLAGSLTTKTTDLLVVECEDTGPGVPLEKYSTLFTPFADVESNRMSHCKMHNSGLGLFSVATEIGSLGGNFGVFPREDLIICTDSMDHDPIYGTVFWFTVPLILPKTTISVGPIDVEEGLKIERNETIETKNAATKIRDQTSPSSTEFTSINDIMKRSIGESNKSTDSETTYPPESSVNLSPKNEPGRQKCVLVIDDSITIRKALSKGLTRLGFHVDEAENGLQGFHRLKAGPYDLVLLDFLMPILDGIDLAKKFRAWEQACRPWFHQYIIGLSAHANGKDAELGLKAGMNRFMSKPITLKTLKDLAYSEAVVNAGLILDARPEETFNTMELGSSKGSCESMNRHCLIVENMPDNGGAISLQRLIELNGWKSVVVKSGDDAMRLLKMRNWDIVIIDNDLPQYSGVSCITRFRDWERLNRMTTQKNIYIVSDIYHSLSLPTGLDGALRKPIDPYEVKHALEIAKHPCEDTSVDSC
eukprot:CCRYP_020462-RA/>CCRYP_020462-RA protein AED:0.06 eAED:0.06 QI:995/1/1/1/0.75/0.66/9/93/889